MRKEDDTLELAAPAGGATLAWYTPVRFDPGLLRRLLEQHDALARRVASLPAQFGRNRTEALQLTQACAGQLHDLRRQEALWLYPVMARSFAGDPLARRRLLNLRFLMNSLARRVLRRLDELAQAMRDAADVGTATRAVGAALTDYRQRNESELYTLYSLMGPGAARTPPTR